MKPTTILTLLTASWLLSACSLLPGAYATDNSARKADGKGERTVQTTTKTALPNGDWQVTSLRGIDTLPADNPPQIKIVADHISGSTGCNRFSGSIEIGANSINIGNVAATKMLCMNRRELEGAFLTALREVRQSRQQDQQWIWLDAAGKQLMILTAE